MKNDSIITHYVRQKYLQRLFFPLYNFYGEEHPLVLLV